MKTFKPTTKLLALIGIGLSFGSTMLFADTVVIVNPNSGVTEITAKQAKSIFLGKSKKLPGGKHATPVEQTESSASRETFNSKVLKKDERKLKAYWSKQVFSGKGQPPKQLADDAAVKAFVNATDGAIGYIDSGSVDSSVKPVFTVK
jgi:ABC-type phosphate transport system substrate-binding protein